MSDKKKMEKSDAAAFGFIARKIDSVTDHRTLMMCSVTLDVMFREIDAPDDFQKSFEKIIAYKSREILIKELGKPEAIKYVDEFTKSVCNG